MMDGREYASGAPGYSIPKVLQAAPIALVKEIVGPGIIELLSAIDPNLTSTESIRTLAARIIDPYQALRDGARRAQILAALPIEKAQELVRRLGLQVPKDVYSALNAEQFGQNTPSA